MAEVLKEDDNEVLDTPEKEELVITETAPQAEVAKTADKRLADEEEDSPEDADKTDKEREAIRERRRLEKLERKERRDKAITRDKIELDFLRNRNDELERRMSLQEQRSQQSELSQVDQAIQKAMADAKMAEDIIAKAVSSGNGEDVTRAMRYRDEAMAKAQQLNAYKQQQATVKPEPQAPKVDPTVVEHAKDFMEDHPWYDVNGRNEESAIVLAIDQSLAKEGYDPKSDDYWDELRRRVARRLPDKVQKKEALTGDGRVVPGVREPRGGPAVGSGKEHAPTSTRREVYISPERKQALIDAGVWDDPVLRLKYVRRYAQYDRDNKA
jgi:hypothetical protein